MKSTEPTNEFKSGVKRMGQCALTILAWNFLATHKIFKISENCTTLLIHSNWRYNRFDVHDGLRLSFDGANFTQM